MGKPVLSKKDLSYLAMIPDAKVQNQTRKAILERKAEGLAKSTAAFRAHLERRSARLNAPIKVEVKESKRGTKFIVVSGGGLLNDVWLSSGAATALIGQSASIKKLIPQITVAVKPEAETEVVAETETEE